LWCEKSEAFCVRPFALHRQQPEEDELKIDFAPTWKNFCGGPWEQATLLSACDNKLHMVGSVDLLQIFMQIQCLSKSSASFVWTSCCVFIFIFEKYIWHLVTNL